MSPDDAARIVAAAPAHGPANGLALLGLLGVLVLLAACLWLPRIAPAAAADVSGLDALDGLPPRVQHPDAPGWHPDPDPTVFALRWWDGTAWTARTAQWQ